VLGGIVTAVTLLVINLLIVRTLYRHQALEHLVEGSDTVLIDKGCLVTSALDKELITRHELEAAAHKQGFETLDQVERCVLESGGTLAMFGRKPSEDDVRQSAVMQRLDRIEALLLAQR